MNEVDNGQNLVATFYIHETLCGIDAMKVQEVIKLMELTEVHHAEEYILGVINLRGKIVTIIDLCKKMGLPCKEVDDNDNKIFIINWKGEYLGLLVDKVSDVISIDKDHLRPPPENVRGVQGRYFENVYQSADHLVSILSIDEVFEGEEGA